MTAVDEQLAGVEDGRHARRDRNRAAVVDALLELYAEGRLAPSSDEIAQRAGLSPRSLFRYFDDIDDLSRAAIRRQQARIDPLDRLPIERAAALAERIAALVDRRVALYEAVGAVAVVARMRALSSAVVAADLAVSRALLRGQIGDLFAAELAAVGAGTAEARLAAIDVLCSYEAYRLLRDDRGFTTAQAAAVLVDALSRLLDSAGHRHPHIAHPIPQETRWQNSAG